MNFVTSLIAQAAPAGQGTPGIMNFLPMILIFGAMYFLLIAPQRKKQKQHQKMISELTSGTDILTTGGIYGTITNVKDDRFVVKVSDTTKIEIAKSAVGSVVSAAE